MYNIWSNTISRSYYVKPYSLAHICCISFWVFAILCAIQLSVHSSTKNNIWISQKEDWMSPTVVPRPNIIVVIRGVDKIKDIGNQPQRYIFSSSGVVNSKQNGIIIAGDIKVEKNFDFNEYKLKSLTITFKGIIPHENETITDTKVILPTEQQLTHHMAVKTLGVISLDHKGNGISGLHCTGALRLNKKSPFDKSILGTVAHDDQRKLSKKQKETQTQMENYQQPWDIGTDKDAFKINSDYEEIEGDVNYHRRWINTFQDRDCWVYPKDNTRAIDIKMDVNIPQQQNIDQIPTFQESIKEIQLRFIYVFIMVMIIATILFNFLVKNKIFTNAVISNIRK